MGKEAGVQKLRGAKWGEEAILGSGEEVRDWPQSPSSSQVTMEGLCGLRHQTSDSLRSGVTTLMEILDMLLFGSHTWLLQISPHYLLKTVLLGGPLQLKEPTFLT